VKLQIYRKPCHHPIEHKLSVVRSLVERSKSLVTDSEDKEKEDTPIEEVLRMCRYPEWSFRKVKRQLNLKIMQKKKS